MRNSIFPTMPPQAGPAPHPLALRGRQLLRHLCLFTAGLTAALNADSISYNFVESNTSIQTLDTTTPKGPLGTTHWNDSIVRTSGSVATGTETDLIDGEGNVTAAAISWSSKETWYGDGTTSTQDQRIVYGYLDDGDAGTGNPGVFVTVSNIPYAVYNVYGIVASDHGSSTTFTCQDFQVNGDTWVLGGSTPVTATAYANMQSSSANGVWTRIQPGTQTGNYWKIEGLTGSTVTIDGQLGINNVARGSLAAIIIEDASDSEPDGMPDNWEIANGLIVGVDDSTLDADVDGLLNLEEYHQGTNPQLGDTDGDGLLDGDEVHVYGTLPLVADTDGDGLSDGDEVLVYFTSPILADTDGDTLPDKWEIDHNLDPNDNGDGSPDHGASGDPDGDGLSNELEYLYGTDPQHPDTDGDGLNDGDEITHSSNPLDPDTDGDGLTDGEEVHVYQTRPDAADSDQDGVNDKVEIDSGHDPNDPDDTPAVTAPITWSVQKDLVTDADISLAGTHFSAYVFGPSFVDVTIGSETISFSPLGGNNGTFYTVNGGTTGNASLDQLLNSHESGNGNWRYVISGLTPGKTYQLQAIAGADRRSGLETRTQIFGDGLGHFTGDLSRGGPGTAIGTFTAGELGTQTLEIHFGSVNPVDPAITALIVREVEISSLAISSFSLNAETSEFTISWISEEGKTYDIEWSDNLVDWTQKVNVAPVPATGANTSFTFPKPSADRRFFRVSEP